MTTLFDKPRKNLVEVPRDTFCIHAACVCYSFDIKHVRVLKTDRRFTKRRYVLRIFLKPKIACLQQLQHWHKRNLVILCPLLEFTVTGQFNSLALAQLVAQAFASCLPDLF